MIIYDVAIIGLGPAGATLAMQLNKNLKVIAIDKKSKEEGSFKKPCGGLLSPDAQKAMAKLNLNLPKEVLVDPQIFYVKTQDLNCDLSRNYQRFYINIDRHKYDCWLISLIPKSVIVEDNSVCISVVKESNLFKVSYSKNGETNVVYAKNIVGSDGANSKVRKLVTNKTPKKYVAIQEWVENKDKQAFYTCVFDKTMMKNYAYTVTKDNYCLLCGILNPHKASEAFEKLKTKIANDWPAPVKREACIVFKPSKFSDFCTGKNSVFLIGEAAGFVSPSSFEGISYAIESASLLAEVLNGNHKNKNKLFKQKSLKIRLKLKQKHWKSKIILNPFLRKLILKSGISSIKTRE